MASNCTVNELPCKCSRTKVSELGYRYYISDDETVLGVLCIQCNLEFLHSERYNRLRGICSDDPVLEWAGLKLRVHTPLVMKMNSSFQVQPFRTPIESVEVIRDFLKKGNHIAWHRNYVIWHQAIVTDINEHHIEIIEFNTHPNAGKLDKAVVLTRVINLKVYQSKMMKDGRLFRLDYPDEVIADNPPELVVARARSLVGDFNGKYNIFNNNCEVFPTFCKTGKGVCWQTNWFIGKIKQWSACSIAENMRIVLSNLKPCVSGIATIITKILPKVSSSAVPFAEAVESIVEYVGSLSPWVANGIGMTLALVIEFIFCLKDIWNIYNAEWNGGMSRKDRGESVKQRVYEALYTVIPSIMLSLGMESLATVFLGLFGVTAGGPFVLVTLVAAIFGGLIGRFIGGMAGSWIASLKDNKKCLKCN